MLFRISHFLVLVMLRLSRALTGDYVCQRVENYTETSQEIFMQPVEVHTFTWCFQIPPRCPKTRKEMHPRYRTKTEVKQRIVNECCEGYTIEEVHGEAGTEAKCVPFCEKCVEGECTSPNNCLCKPGYQGVDCSYECQPETWGKYCVHECNCTRESACNPVNGRCECPPGWQGIRCEEKCPPGRWGLYCGFTCSCSDQLSGCHHETGECFDLEVSFDPVPTVKDWTLSELTPSSGATTDISSPLYSEQENNTDFIDVTNPDDFDDSNLDDLQIIRISRTTEETENDSLKASLKSSETQATMHIQSSTKKYSYEETRSRGSTTYQTLQVPVSTEIMPRKNPISTTNTGQVHIFEDQTGNQNFDSGKPGFGSTDEFGIDPQVVMSPKTDYVKNVRRESSTSVSPLPMDIAALVVIGSIISLGLTSVAALMIFHMRAKLFEAVRSSIFNDEKVNCSAIEKGNVERISTIHGNTLARTLTRTNPPCSAVPEPKAILTLDETGNEYANGGITIGIRLSSNLRELLESQYDRPASFCHRGAPQTEMEHVYDEIPLSSPFCITKNT
ncbi:uncharacterized protein LOC117171670 [Belonocnema kinseyi]|uniref:uncharacterized protein LOC117171670 n=1 Tax=Belonocnema kinseyi TaxID=2817044 RepID=UPI00143DBA56|nr:uncharacterized protein LOC117171670 [Belonocnema kinseyi]